MARTKQTSRRSRPSDVTADSADSQPATSAPCLKRVRVSSLAEAEAEEEASAADPVVRACAEGECACGLADAYFPSFQEDHLSGCVLTLDRFTASSFTMHHVSMADIAQYGIHRVLAVVYGGKVVGERFAEGSVQAMLEINGRFAGGSVSTEEMHAALGCMFSPSRQYVREDMEAAGLSPLSQGEY